MSRDGLHAAVITDGRAVLHDLDAGTERVLGGEGPGLGAGPVVLSPAGDRLAGVSKDGALTIWGESTEIGPTCAARRLRWTADSGELLALCRGDELIRWRPGEAERRQPLAGGRDLFVWPDGESLAVLHVDGAVRLRSPDGEDVRELGFADPLGTLVADPDGEHLLAVGRNAKRFAFATLEEEAATAFDGVGLAASRLGAGAAVTAQGDGTVALRNRRGEVVRKLAHGEARVVAVDLSANGEVALTVDETGRARFWRLGDQPPVYLGSHASPVEHLAFVPGTSQVAAGTDSGTVRLWDAVEGGGRVLGQHPSSVRHLAPAPNGALLASASREPGVRLWSLPTGDALRTVAGDAREGPSAIAWSPGATRLAVGTCRVDGTCPVLVHELEAETTAALGEHERAATHLVFATSGQRLLALHPNDAATAPTAGEIWDLERGEGHALAIGRVGLPVAATFEAEGEGARIAYAANDRTQLRVFGYGPDGGAGGSIFVELELLTVVSDGQQPILLLQSTDGQLTLWDLRDDALAVIGERAAMVESLVVSPERDQVLLTGGGEPARVVELGSGESRALLESPRVAAWGETLVGAGKDGRIEAWRDVAPTEPEAFLRWIRDLTDAEIDLQALR
jgi:WD40 repeat protein